MFSVAFNHVAVANYCNGLTATIVEGQTRFVGTRDEVVAALRAIPVGVSITTRYPGGIRSCMNKPALWDAIAEMPA